MLTFQIMYNVHRLCVTMVTTDFWHCFSFKNSSKHSDSIRCKKTHSQTYPRLKPYINLLTHWQSHTPSIIITANKPCRHPNTYFYLPLSRSFQFNRHLFVNSLDSFVVVCFSLSPVLVPASIVSAVLSEGIFFVQFRCSFRLSSIQIFMICDKSEKRQFFNIWNFVQPKWLRR